MPFKLTTFLKSVREMHLVVQTREHFLQKTAVKRSHKLTDLKIRELCIYRSWTKANILSLKHLVSKKPCKMSLYYAPHMTEGEVVWLAPARWVTSWAGKWTDWTQLELGNFLTTPYEKTKTKQPPHTSKILKCLLISYQPFPLSAFKDKPQSDTT